MLNVSSVCVCSVLCCHCVVSSLSIVPVANGPGGAQVRRDEGPSSSVSAANGPLDVHVPCGGWWYK